MKFHQLNTPRHKSKTRLGRGNSSGHGTTAGRGTKGQHARTGSRAKPGFEGGQNPLMQRLPKLRGFKSHRTPAETVYLSDLEALSAQAVTAESLAEAGLISSPYVSVKLLAKGSLAKKKTVKLPLASQSAIAAVEQAGGSFETVDKLKRPASQRPTGRKANAKANVKTETKKQ